MQRKKTQKKAYLSSSPKVTQLFLEPLANILTAMGITMPVQLLLASRNPSLSSAILIEPTTKEGEWICPLTIVVAYHR